MNQETLLLQILQEVKTCNKKIDALAVKVDALETKVDALEARITALEVKVDALEERITALEVKVEALEAKVDANFATLDTKITSLDTKLTALEQKVDNEVIGLRGEIVYVYTFVQKLASAMDWEMVQKDRVVKNLRQIEKIPTIEKRVDYVEEVVGDHSQQIRILQAAK